MVVLASASPRRLELLRRAGLNPVVDAASIDETAQPGESPTALAVRLAAGKRAVVAARHASEDVIAADTVVDLDGEVLGQPAHDADAADTLRRLAGRTHLVHTAVAVRVGGRERASLVTSRVTFRRLDEARIAWYVATREPHGKAGAYGVQGLGMALVARVEGSFTNVVGLPLPETLRLLG